MKWWGLFLGCFLFTSFITQDAARSDGAAKISKDSKNEIKWSSGVKLKWDDFQGKPDSGSSYKAMTTTSIRTVPNEFTEEVVDYDFLCLFDKKDSWKKIEADALLKHEQLHFDIAELATRNLRKEFSEHRFVSLKGVNAHLKKVFSNAVAMRKKMGQEYDADTKHGIVEEEQRKWETKVAEELKQLDEYADSKVVLRKIKK